MFGLFPLWPDALRRTRTVPHRIWQRWKKGRGNYGTGRRCQAGFQEELRATLELSVWHRAADLRSPDSLRPLRKAGSLRGGRNSPRIPRMAQMVVRGRCFHPCHPWFLLRLIREISQRPQRGYRKSIFGVTQRRKDAKGRRVSVLFFASLCLCVRLL